MPTQSQLDLRTRAVGPWPMNTYVLVCPDTNQSVLIDPGAEPDTLLEMLGDSEPVAILLTHTHPDHVMALDEMKQRLGVPVYAHPGPHNNPVARDVEPDETLTDGDTFQLGEHTLRVIHTPGHTHNMLTFMLDDPRAIVGDTLFEGGPGKTWSHEDFELTLDTLRNVVLLWPDDTICYPGHGPAFRLGDKREEIAAFLAKDHGNFYGDAEW